MNDASPFAARTVAVLVVLGAVLGLAALLMSGFGDDLARLTGDRPGADAPHGAGYQAFRRIAAEVNGAADPEPDPADTAALLILTPTEQTRPEDVKAIVDARLARAEAAMDGADEADDPPLRFATLIILPKWKVEPLPLTRGRVRRTGELPDDLRARFVPVAVQPHGEQRADIGIRMTGSGLLPFAIPESVAAIAGRDLQPWIAARDGAAVLARVGTGDTYVLADPDLVNNRAMADVRNAQAGVAMLRAIDPEAGGRAAFDTSLHYRPGNRNLVRLLFTPPFLGVTVALLAAAILAGIAAANRFGPVMRERRALPPGKRALIDNVAALTRLAGRTARSGERYADAMLDTLARRLRIAVADREDRLGALEAVRAGYRDIDNALRSARTERDAVAAARDLYHWRREAGA